MKAQNLLKYYQRTAYPAETFPSEIDKMFSYIFFIIIAKAIRSRTARMKVNVFFRNYSTLLLKYFNA